MVENIALDNLSNERRYSTPAMSMVSPQPVQQPDAGFGNLHIDPGDHCQTLDNVNKRSDNRLYVRLRQTLRIQHKAPFRTIFTNLLHFRVVFTRVFFKGNLHSKNHFNPQDIVFATTLVLFFFFSRREKPISESRIFVF